MENQKLFEIQELPINIPPLPERSDLVLSLEKLIVGASDLEVKLENEQKRGRKETMALLRDMLEVIDSLDRIVTRLAKTNELSPGEKRLKGNIEATRRLALQKLKRSGVTSMELVGKELNPNLASAEDYEIHQEMEDETVVEELVKGYFWNGIVLRPGSVIVSKQNK